MRMRSRLFFAVIAAGGIGLACRPRHDAAQLRSEDAATGTEAEALQPQDPPQEEGTEAAASECGEVNALATGKMTGQEVFDLTARCVFDRDTHEVRIRIFGETFQKVLDDGCADKDSGYGHVIELVLDGKRIENVGIKVRGNTSKCNPKRQFKFKFDADKMFSVLNGQKEVKEFAENDGRTFFGLEGFSVRTSANDPTMIRERISSRVFTDLEDLARTGERGGLVYRVAFTKFFVSFNRPKDQGAEGSFTRLKDGYWYDYKGFYSLAENIDKTYLRTRFQTGDDKLKGFYLFQADKAKASFTKATYQREGWSPAYIDGKKAEGEDVIQAGEAKLFELFDLLAKPNVTDAELEALIDVDNITNYVSGAMLAGHWDSMLGNNNNDHLFFHGKKKKWQIITWDLDNSQGALIDQFHALMSGDIYKQAKNRGKLFEVLYAQNRTAFRGKLKDRLKKLVSGPASESAFNQSVDMLENQVKNTVENWEGYNHGAFDDIKSFAKARRNAMKPQL